MKPVLLKTCRITLIIIVIGMAIPTFLPVLLPGAGDAVLAAGYDNADNIESIDTGPLLKGDPKLDSSLNLLVSEFYERQFFPSGESESAADKQTVRVIVESLSGYEQETAEISKTFGTIEASYDNLFQLSIPVSSLKELADNHSVYRVKLPYKPEEQAVTSEGVAVINAPEWQDEGYDGTGVKIGILDGGFAGYTTLQSGGELPPSIQTNWAASLSGPGSSSHGTACAEIVYDIAPGASFYFANFTNEVEFGTAVAWFITQGVNIVSCSMCWPGVGPGDGTGPIDEIVETAYDAGILWCQSAGNYAQRHWSGNWVDSNSNNALDFATSMLDEGNTIVVTNRSIISGILNWNDTWGASSNDYDLVLVDSSSNIVAASAATQGGDDDPYEGLVYTATYDGYYYFAIIASGTPASSSNFDLYSSYNDLQYQVATGSIAVPADSPNVMTVGAVPWDAPNIIESFSSQGPNKGGVIKPDIVAPDGVSTVTYGTEAFLGTSAAAPAAAGASALVKNRFSEYTHAQIITFIEQRVADLGSSDKDNIFGNGLINLCLPDLTVTTLQATNVNTTGATLNGRLTSLGSFYTANVSFEYGTTTSYGDSTTEETISNVGTFYAAITGLNS